MVCKVFIKNLKGKSFFTLVIVQLLIKHSDKFHTGRISISICNFMSVFEWMGMKNGTE